MAADCTEKGYAVIRAFEGRALKAYRDAVGVWTIGFGITNYDKWAVEYLGRPIGAGMEITEEQAEYLLRESIRRDYAPAVAAAMPNAKPNEIDGGTSFHYNTGAIARASWVKYWAAGNVALMRESLLAWNKAGGNVLAGLTRRRKREDAIIENGDYGPEGNQAPPTLDANGRVIHSGHLEGTPGMLRKGDAGPEVKAVQAALIVLGFKIDPREESHFGVETEASVLAFQKSHPQLVADGIVGPATRAALTREADAKRKLKNVTTGTGGTGGVVVTADQVAGWHLPMSVYVALAVVGFAAIAYFAWKYRDEIVGIAKRGSGK